VNLFTITDLYVTIFTKEIGGHTMKHVTCLKCGGTDIDDGSTRVLTMLGLPLIGAGTLVLLITCLVGCIEDWGYFVPLAHADPMGMVVLILGIMMMFQGMERSERVKCRRCGTIWTPPKPTARQYHAIK
jgi:hypothetical protein